MNTTEHAAPRLARAVVHLPRTVLIGVLKAYRFLISPLYGQVCRFYPSCSAYALEAVTVHGALKGTWLAGCRLLKCHPFNDGGVDHVPAGKRTWPEGKVPRIVVLNHPPLIEDESPSYGVGAK